MICLSFTSEETNFFFFGKYYEAVLILPECLKAWWTLSQQIVNYTRETDRDEA